MARTRGRKGFCLLCLLTPWELLPTLSRLSSESQLLPAQVFFARVSRKNKYEDAYLLPSPCRLQLPGAETGCELSVRAGVAHWLSAQCGA